MRLIQALEDKESVLSVVRRFLLFSLFIGIVLSVAMNARAIELVGDASLPIPPTRAELENIPKLNIIINEETNLPFDIRLDAMREAGLSYGARGGLAWRTFRIREELEKRASYMNKVYAFQNLLIPAPSGLLIEPPVISESINALIVESRGQTAAVSDRVYRINKTSKIVSAPQNWRNYLERDWGEVAAPPDILLPGSENEREKWIRWIREGWEQGVTQADDIFQEDLNRLMADYKGMVRYRILLAQGIISPPYTLQVDRGITGSGNVMRIGDRAVEITGSPEFLVVGSDKWQPASR